MRILVIEDYTPIRENVVNLLTEEGYAVDSSDTGDEGLWYAQNHSYDVIILDLMLPNMNGVTVLTHLRMRGDNTPVIVISARDSVQARIDGLNAGADDYLIKPFSLQELLARIKAQTRKKYGSKSNSFKLETLSIDFDARRVTRLDQEIILTKREYGILEYLARRCGEVVSRMEIWDHVYQENGDYTSNAVDVYIGYLRKKLNIQGEPNMIHTRRGQGYYLDASVS